MKDKGWVRTPIDSFILANLEANGLKPAPEADLRTLARRVALDLTGLPPEPADVDALVAAVAAEPKKLDVLYEKYVDKLIESPHWGEHRGRYWLDYARYGDTHGIHMDNFREIWSYRDWVIRAFNENKPFDQFTIEQLAGDLLPNPTIDQLIATGFNRCNITTSEGGADQRGVPRPLCPRPHRNHVASVDGSDDGLRGLPRPQVRPASARATSTRCRHSSTTRRRTPWMGTSRTRRR